MNSSAAAGFAADGLGKPAGNSSDYAVKNDIVSLLNFPFLPLTNLPLAILAGALVAAAQSPKPPAATLPPAQLQAAGSLFSQNCGFCHGRDAGGGEDGPDLTRSKLVAADVNGDKIAPVIRDGRPEQGMPKFALPANDIAGLVAFIHDQKTKAESQKGGRRGVDVADLQTGNADAGKQYFNGAGKCASCHSPTGDFAGLAKRLEGLRLEERMLYPRGAKAKVTVTLPSGQTVAGELAYRDEFTIGLRDAARKYHSWSTKLVKYKVDEPAEAHVELLAKYTDADIHNLMAYLQTLR
jgi:cytochrome c oxidase cbb3-type subunit 3